MISIVLSELCKSRKDRSVELLTIGNGARKVFLSTRHHCQESMATYALEGIMREVIEHQKEYDDFCFIIVPFVDKDALRTATRAKCAHHMTTT